MQIAYRSRAPSPPAYLSYQNVRNGLPSYQGLLTPRIAPRCVKPTLGHDLPPIGTYRFTGGDMQKMEKKTGFVLTSLSVDDAFLFMSVTELRVEDYYLLRMSHPSSELCLAAQRAGLNALLHRNTQIQRTASPNCNRPSPARSPGRNNSNSQLSSPFAKNNQLNHYNTQAQLPFNNALQTTPYAQLSQNSLSSQGNAFSNFPKVNNPYASGGQEQPRPQSNLSNSKFQTPAERFSHLPIANNFKNSNNTANNTANNSQQEFKSPPNPFAPKPPNNLAFSQPVFNPQQPQPQPLPYPQQLPKTSLDSFLQYFYGDLRQAYSQGLFLTSVLQEYLRRNSQQGLEQGGNRRERACEEVKALMNGLQRSIEERHARKDWDTAEMSPYASEVWNALQSIHQERMAESYTERDRVPEAVLRAFTQKMEEEQETRMYQASLLNLDQPQQARGCSIASTAPFCPIFSDLHQADHRRAELVGRVCALSRINDCLLALELGEKGRREEQAFDYDRRVQNLAEIDDFHYRRRKHDQDVVIVVCGNPKQPLTTKKTSQKLTPKTEPNSESKISPPKTSLPPTPLAKTPSVSRFEFAPKKNPGEAIVHFMATIVWIDNPQKVEAYRCFEGTFTAPKPICAPQLQEFIKKRLQFSYGAILRQDAQYKFTELPTSQPKEGHMAYSLKIHQKKLNITAPYSFEAEFKRHDDTGVDLTSLTISNSHGRMEWGGVCIAELDFLRGQLEIGDSAVTCNYRCLHAPCRITFFALPHKITQMEGRSSRSQMEERLRRQVGRFEGMELEDIDWDRRHYSVKAGFSAEESESEESNGLEELEKEAKRLGINDFSVTESVLI